MSTFALISDPHVSVANPATGFQAPPIPLRKLMGQPPSGTNSRVPQPPPTQISVMRGPLRVYLMPNGARIDVDAYRREWRAKDGVYQQLSRRYWLYF